MPSPQQRSKGACQACKNRKRKCDETRPACRACIVRGVTCPGYQLQLKWDVGIASRGRFTGADKPLDSAVPNRVKGRARDMDRVEGGLSDKVRVTDSFSLSNAIISADLDSETQSSDGEFLKLSADSPDLVHDPALLALGQARFQDFLESGHLDLFAAGMDESPLREALPQITNCNDALFAVCVALQILSTDGECEAFFVYYQVALSRFQRALEEAAGTMYAVTLCTSCLLCTICIYQGLPWTQHLGTLHRLLQSFQSLSFLDLQYPKLVVHLLEVMGVMDLPTFVIGRQTPVLGIWQELRQSMHNNGATRLSGVEPVSGLPRSLIDIFARINQAEAEVDLWLWPGEVGRYLQQHLWDAYRFSGMLRHRQSRRMLIADTLLSAEVRSVVLPSSEILVNRVLAALSAISQGLHTEQGHGLLVKNSLSYCIAAIALEKESLNSHSEWSLSLDNVIQEYIAPDKTKNSVCLQHLLQSARISQGDFDIDTLGKAMQAEVALF